MMKTWIAAVLLVCLCGFVQAELVRGIDIDFVDIGGAGNSADSSTGFGAVGYNYSVGKYEITNGQWDQFVTAAGAPTGSTQWAYYEGSTWAGEDVPVSDVSWLEAVQFCNYLTSGDKSKGAYQFSGTNEDPGGFVGVNRSAALSSYGVAYVLPTEDEWYKAAYYSGAGVYSKYANGSSIAPESYNSADPDSNYDQAVPWVGPWEVGVTVPNGSVEQNGTYDMMGNLWEWNESAVSDGVYGIRGGAYYDVGDSLSYLASDYSSRGAEYLQLEYVGFRVAQIDVIPEPATLLIMGIGGVLVFRRRGRF